MRSSALRQLVWIGRLEGVSLLVLLAALPIKYLAHDATPVRTVGLVHALVFMLFLLALGRAARLHAWPSRRTFAGFLASIVPFGPFWFERQMWRERVLGRPDKGAPASASG